MLISILLQIFTRIVLTVPFPWTDELARFSFLFLCFFGSVMTLRYKLHLGIDYFVGKFNKKSKFIDYAFVQIAVITFGLFIGVLGFRLLGIVSTQVSPILRVPMVFIYAILPATGFLYAILGFYELKSHLQAKRDDAPKIEEIDLSKEVQL
jgi:TRAP-type C4-dicarboxylate transport system permease small subunit